MRVELQEYGDRSVELDEDQAIALQRAAGNALDVQIGTERGRRRLKAGGVVGTIVAGDVTVLIRPKVELANLFHLLGVRPPSFQPAEAALDTDLGLLAAMAATFARSVDAATGRGVHRHYRATEERLMSPRGRLDLVAQLRRPGTPIPLACRFDEFTTDVFLNRVLVAAIHRLRRVPGLGPGLRSDLNRLLARFEEVALVDIDCRRIDEWRWGRLDRHYRTPVVLAGLILRDLTLVDRLGATATASFRIDMPALYQDFVTDRLSRALLGHLSVEAEPSVPFALDAALNLQPDVVFTRDGVRRYVGDVKYKLSSGPARMSDYQQLLTYCSVMGLDEGVLLYADDPDSPSRADGLVHTVTVRNLGTRLHTYRIPLTGTIDELEKQLRTAARWIAERSRPEARWRAA